MTWSVNITDQEGNKGENGADICVQCQHNGACNVNKVSWPIGNTLTSIDVGSDDHMASGTAVLQCAGYEQKEESADS